MAVKTCVGLTPVPVDPSPNVQAYEAIVPPASEDRMIPAPPTVVGVAVNDAVGTPVGTVTVTFWVDVAVEPRLSVTVSTTAYVPLALYVCDAVAPLTAGELSPKFQL